MVAFTPGFITCKDNDRGNISDVAGNTTNASYWAGWTGWIVS